MVNFSDSYYAGLIEGDGSISGDPRWNCPRIYYKCTDLDIVHRVATFLLDRTVRETKTKKNCKPAWVTELHGVNGLSIIKKLYPFLRPYRRQQILRRYNYSETAPPRVPDIPWLAGLLEAEGYFRYNERTYKIALNMTDYDVVTAVRDTFAPEAAIRLRTKYQPQYKQQYNIYICGTLAETIMKSILPYMGSRRTAQINKALSRNI